MARAEARRHDPWVVGSGELPYHLLLGGDDVLCPVCGRESVPFWRPWVTTSPTSLTDGTTNELRSGKDRHGFVALDWMRCSNEACEQLIVRVHEQRAIGALVGGAPMVQTDTWIVRPRFGEAKRKVDSVVPEPFRTDFLEAAALLEISPRSTAVLARSILADLLADYAGLKDFNFSKRVDQFRADETRPYDLRENMHHFREIGDFGAHTQKSDQDVVLAVDRESAEWMLEFIDQAFAYFIVGPEKNRRIRSKWDANIDAAGRKPIPPLASAEEEET